MSKILMVAGLAFGDEGKGSIVDYLTRIHGAKWVIRYNGGAQAAHNVVLPDALNTQHTFAQFGSGSFAGAKTYLSEYMLINPLTLALEWRSLRDMQAVPPKISDVIRISSKALITNRYQIALNRLRELARDNRHGSCGMGIGETMLDHIEHPELDITVADLAKSTNWPAKLRASQKLKLEQGKELLEALRSANYVSAAAIAEMEILESEKVFVELVDKYLIFGSSGCVDHDDNELEKIMRGDNTIVFEGAQGVLLDEWYGFHPYTTWSTTTFKNADDICWKFRFDVQEVTKIGVVRSYYTRHGAGPFPTEDPSLGLEELHNLSSPWQQGFRVGHFDLNLLKYAVNVVGGVDEIALTHMDSWIPRSSKLCWAYNSDQDLRGKSTRLCSRNPGARFKTHYHLRHDPQQDVNEQAKLTSLLPALQPQYVPLHNLETLTQRIEELAPVRIESWGPTAADKRYRNRPRP